jgi:hypothetical protein
MAYETSIFSKAFQVALKLFAYWLIRLRIWFIWLPDYGKENILLAFNSGTLQKFGACGRFTNIGRIGYVNFTLSLFPPILMTNTALVSKSCAW